MVLLLYISIINNPPLYSGKGRFSFLRYVQLKNLKRAKMASRWLEERTDLQNTKQKRVPFYFESFQKLKKRN